MNIIEMARQAGMVYREFEDEFANGNTDGVDLKTMQVFAALVAAAARADEREACAKLADELFADVPAYSAPDCAAAIRARGAT
jgi:hypothetical protein